MSHRYTNVPGGVPKVLDYNPNPDGDPNLVTNTYALRDAILHWIDKALGTPEGASGE